MEIKLKTLTPVHIGTGNSYGMEGFIVENNKLKRIIFSKFYDSLSEKQKNELLSELERENFSLNEFVKKKNIKISEDTVLHSISTKFIPNKVREQIKANNIPYIPGSSIKGAIRTALLWRYLHNNFNSLRILLEKSIEEILYDKKLRPKEKKGKIGNNFVSSVFTTKNNNFDARYDILKFLYVSDFIPKDYELVIENVKTYSLKNSKLEKHFNNFVETITGSFYGTISLSPQIKVALENGEEYPLLKDKLKILGLHENDLDNLELAGVEKKMINYIKETLTEFNKWALKKEIELCEKANNGKLFVERLKRIETENSIRVGFSIGTTYQTLIKMIEERDVRLARDIVNNLRLGGRSNREIENNRLSPPYPKSIEFTQQGEPLGWLKFG